MGGVAADRNGLLWFESGDPSDGQIVKATSNISVQLLRSGVDFAGRSDRDTDASARRLSSSRLSPDGAGGVLIAGPTSVLQLDNGLVTIAGRSSSPGQPGQGQQGQGQQGRGQQDGGGDGQPFGQARFTSITALTTDAAGNVYVADELDRQTGRVAVRFLNRSAEPIIFYPSTAQELTVAPGTIQTIAGGDNSPVGALFAQASALAVTTGRLYLAGRAPAATGAAVQMLNLGRAELSMHGVTVPPAGAVTVATVTGSARSGSPALSALPGIAADDQGNLYLAEHDNHLVRRVDAAGTVSIFAGTGAAGYNGNQRPATSARLDRPYDVEVGPGGRVYISDLGNSELRVVDPAGVIRAALGNGMTSGWSCQPSPDGSPQGAQGAPAASAASAPLQSMPGQPVSVAGDAAGNVYLGVPELRQVQRLAPSGSVAPVAGRAFNACLLDPSGCPAGDDLPPAQAPLGGIVAVTPGPAGGLYVVELVRVRFLNLSERPVDLHGVSVPAGALRTLLGPKPSAAPPADPNALAPARYTAAAADGRGNLLFADLPADGTFFGKGAVRQLDAQGTITTLIEPPGLTDSFEIDRSRCCSFASDLATDAAGNLYIADTDGEQVWFLNRSSTAVVVHAVSVPPGALVPVAGVASGGSQEEGIKAVEAQLSSPNGITLDGSGNLYIADTLENNVSRVGPDGTIMTVVGTGTAGFNGDGLVGQLTGLNRPKDMTLDVCGNLLIADTGNGRVRRLNLVASCALAGPPGASTDSNRIGAAGVGVLTVAGALLAGRVARRRRRRAQHDAAPGRGLGR